MGRNHQIIPPIYTSVGSLKWELMSDIWWTCLNKYIIDNTCKKCEIKLNASRFQYQGLDLWQGNMQKRRWIEVRRDDFSKSYSISIWSLKSSKWPSAKRESEGLGPSRATNLLSDHGLDKTDGVVDSRLHWARLSWTTVICLTSVARAGLWRKFHTRQYRRVYVFGQLLAEFII